MRNPVRSSVCLVIGVALVALLFGCEDTLILSKQKASEHVRFLEGVARVDIEEVRNGLPKGAAHLAKLWAKGGEIGDPQRVQVALHKARSRVQDLRTAKSTFFAVVLPDGAIVRNDHELDQMAGLNIFKPFPELRATAGAKYVETLGAMKEADEVRGKPDAQWVAAVGIQAKSDTGVLKDVGLYVTGWAWSFYCRRLENALRSKIDETESGKKPLYYVFVVTEGGVFGTAPSPLINAQAIEKLKPLEQLKDGHFSAQLEITGRGFGLAAQQVKAFGQKVAIAVLRSET